MYCYIYIPSKPPLGLASLTLPPSRLGIAQASLALLSTWRRLKKGDLVASLRQHQIDAVQANAEHRTKANKGERPCSFVRLFVFGSAYQRD